jgi:hypothetical protein
MNADAGRRSAGRGQGHHSGDKRRFENVLHCVRPFTQALSAGKNVCLRHSLRLLMRRVPAPQSRRDSGKIGP